MLRNEESTKFCEQFVVLFSFLRRVTGGVMRIDFLRISLICCMVLIGSFCLGQFRPGMPSRPPLPAPMRPPVIIVQNGQLGMSGGMSGMGGQLGMSGGFGGQLGMGGMMGMGGGFGGQLGVSGMGGGMSGMGMGGMGGGMNGNNNPYGAYTPGTIVRPIGQSGPYSIIPIAPGYMIGQQGMGGGFGGMMGMSGGFGGQLGMGGGVLGGQGNFGGFSGNNFGMGGMGSFQGLGQSGVGFGGMKGMGFNGGFGI